MSDQMKGSPGVSAPGLALGLDRVQPSQEFRAGGVAARVGSGGDHALCRGIPAPVPPRDERRVGEDGSPEQRVVGLARSLQSTQQCLTRPLRLAQVEELDTPREHPRLGQRRGHRAPGLAGGLGQQRAAQCGVRNGCRVQRRGCDGPVQAPMGPGHRLKIGGHGGRLHGDCGLHRHRSQTDSSHGRPDQVAPNRVRSVAACRCGESERFHILAEQLGESLGDHIAVAGFDPGPLMQRVLVTGGPSRPAHRA